MGEFKGTPGPWTTAATNDSLVLKGRQKIASAFETPDDIWGAANARLIAASPTMLDAAQRLLAVNDEFERRQSLGVAAAIEQLAGVQQHSATELRAMGVKALADLRAALSLATGEA